MEATTPELGSVGFWSPKSSSFSGSDSIVVEDWKDCVEEARSPGGKLLVGGTAPSTMSNIASSRERLSRAVLLPVGIKR